VSYYGTGDYYLAGAPGLLSSIGGFIKGAASGFLGSGGSPISAITGGVRGAGRSPMALPFAGGAPRIPAGRGGGVDASGMPRRKRRRMNYANGKALTRANRRVDGFVKLARKSLQHTNYKIVTKQSGSSRSKRVSVSEHGPGGVVVR